VHFFVAVAVYVHPFIHFSLAILEELWQSVNNRGVDPGGEGDDPPPIKILRWEYFLPVQNFCLTRLHRQTTPKSTNTYRFACKIVKKIPGPSIWGGRTQFTPLCLTRRLQSLHHLPPKYKFGFVNISCTATTWPTLYTFICFSWWNISVTIEII